MRNTDLNSIDINEIEVSYTLIQSNLIIEIG